MANAAAVTFKTDNIKTALDAPNEKEKEPEPQQLRYVSWTSVDPKTKARRGSMFSALPQQLVTWPGEPFTWPICGHDGTISIIAFPSEAMCVAWNSCFDKEGEYIIAVANHMEHRRRKDFLMYITKPDKSVVDFEIKLRQQAALNFPYAELVCGPNTQTKPIYFHACSSSSDA